MDDLVFYLHLGSLAVAAVGVLIADKFAWNWFTGKKDALLRRHLEQAHVLVLGALILLILTGLYLFWPIRTYLLHQPLFYLKMGFVLALALNSFVIGEIMHISTRKSFRSLSHKEKTPLFISGAVSLACWLGAGVTALVLFGF